MLRGPSTDDRYLAPSYDHASALGFNLRDERRALHFQDPNMMEGFWRKGTAYRFEGSARVTLVEHAHTALTMAGTATCEHWLDRLSGIDDGDFERLAARTTVMSDLGRRFAVHVLASNRRRLLHD